MRDVGALIPVYDTRRISKTPSDFDSRNSIGARSRETNGRQTRNCTRERSPWDRLPIRMYRRIIRDKSLFFMYCVRSLTTMKILENQTFLDFLKIYKCVDDVFQLFIVISL